MIDEDYLFAYRDYELTQGGDGESKAVRATQSAEQVHGAAGRRVRASRSTSTSGATTTRRPAKSSNVIVENDTDRRWYEREFMRVDWSKNLLPGFYGQTYNLNELLGIWQREPTDLYVQDASAFPDVVAAALRPHGLRRLGDDERRCSEDERDLADDYEQDELYHMSFVTPGDALARPRARARRRDRPADRAQVNWCAEVRYSRRARVQRGRLATCARASCASATRASTSRSTGSTRASSASATSGSSQDVYDRSTGTPDDPAFGATDFLNYNVNRHNIWKQWRDDDGEPLPYDRARRAPDRLVHDARAARAPGAARRSTWSAQWNEVFMETVRQLRGEALPSYPDVDCQTDDPDGYCFCQRGSEHAARR